MGARPRIALKCCSRAPTMGVDQVREQFRGHRSKKMMNTCAASTKCRTRALRSWRGPKRIWQSDRTSRRGHLPTRTIPETPSVMWMAGRWVEFDRQYTFEVSDKHKQRVRGWWICSPLFFLIAVSSTRLVRDARPQHIVVRVHFAGSRDHAGLARVLHGVAGPLGRVAVE